METAAVENEVRGDDGQHEEATENPTSPVHDRVHNGETNQRSDGQDDPEAATDTGERNDDDGELLESSKMLQRQSEDGSTEVEPPAESSHSPPGT